MSDRIVLEVLIRDDDIILIDVGRHDQLYRSDRNLGVTRHESPVNRQLPI